jgi:hypothetical protein
MMSESKRNFLAKSNLQAEKRAQGLSSELSDNELNVETLEQMKKRERAALFIKLKDMEPNARRKLLREQAELHAIIDED